MDFYEVDYTDRLCGEITIQGSKNSVLPMIAASILARDITIIDNCPDILDVSCSINILTCLGCKVARNDNTLYIDARQLLKSTIPLSLAGKMRSSILYLGTLLSRNKEAHIARPGGCNIGERPIDYHIWAMEKLGASVDIDDDEVYAYADRIVGTDITLTKISVGTTENIMLAASVGEGMTTIHNAARDPEICELQEFLNSMGAKISGAGTDCIKIKGVMSLHGTRFKVNGDRIVAATYMMAVCLTGGKVTLHGIDGRNCKSTIELLRQVGAHITYTSKKIKIYKRDKCIKPVEYIETGSYPAIPTDIQPFITTLMLGSRVCTVIRENVFENRFGYVQELVKMGAHIGIVDNSLVVVDGNEVLHGYEVYAKDLRGGAALILAGLVAKGVTRVYGTEYIYRGYERIAEDIQRLGGRVWYRHEEEDNNNSD